MKNLIYLLLLTIFIGCNSDLSEGVSKAKNIDNMGNAIFLVTYDDCEYLIYDGYQKSGIIHKGNCKNKIHKKNGIQ